MDIRQYLQGYVGKEVTVHLKNHEKYQGRLLDVEMSLHEGIGNILLENSTCEWQLIRGDFISYIQL